MPFYLSIGLSETFVDESCPKDLEPYMKARDMRLDEQDYFAWITGLYVNSAVSVAIDHCFNGRKARSEYIKEPILVKHRKENKPLTEEEIQNERMKFLDSLMIMQTNFELNQKTKAV